MPTEPVLDCHHVDITAIVEERELARANRKWFNRRRYERMRDRMPHVWISAFNRQMREYEAHFDRFIMGNPR